MNNDRRERDKREHQPSPQGPRGERQEAQPTNDESWVRAVICEGNYALLDVNAKELGDKLADEVSKTQLRALFGTLKRLELLRDEELEKQLTMLRPRLAYAAARTKNRDFDRLKRVLTAASEHAQKAPRERTQRLVDLMEAILCYSRAATSRRTA